MEWGKWCPGATPAPAPHSVVIGQPYGTGVLLHLPIVEVLLCVPISGLLLWGCSHSTGAEWLRPSGHYSPHLKDRCHSVASAGAEERICDGSVAGPVWNSASVSHIKPVLQHSQFQQTTLSCSASPDSLPCTANPTPFVVDSSSPPKDPPKIQFAFPCSQTAIFTAGEEAAAEEGGELARQSRAAGMLHQHAEPRASSTVAGQRLAHPDTLLWGEVEIQPQK